MASQFGHITTVTSLLAARAAGGAATSLPLVSFDMEAQHEVAFRALQGGLNTGKVVVRMATRQAGVGGGHLVHSIGKLKSQFTYQLIF